MRYTLTVRKLQESDLGPASSSFPDPEEYEMYLDALNHDIAQIAGVTSAKREGFCIHIETSRELPGDELQRTLKPIFSSSLGTFLRYESIHTREA